MGPSREGTKGPLPAGGLCRPQVGRSDVIKGWSGASQSVFAGDPSGLEMAGSDVRRLHFTSIFVWVVLVAGSWALLTNNKSRPLLKFCFNSRDQFVQAQCVLCDFYQFSATVLGCNGRTSALMSNITSTEAVCIISNCLQQVRQAQPQFTGRRRRDSPETTTEDLDRQEVIEEKKEVAPSVEEFLNRYVMLDGESLRELEDRVVDKIEVTVDAGEEDYEA